MAGRSKATSSKVPKVEIVNKLGTPTKCLSCGRTFAQQKGFFSPSYSTFYASNNGFLPICRDCVEALLKKYIEELDDDEEAFERICIHLDLYYSHDIYKSSKGDKGISFLMSNYFSRSNGLQYFRLGTKIHKTYDDTLRENKIFAEVEAARLLEEERLAKEKAELAKNPVNLLDTIEDFDDIRENKEIKTKPKTIKFWGLGFEPLEYEWLDDEYSSWVIRANNGESPSKSLESTLKEMCKTSIDIKRARKNGAKANEISSLQSTYIKYMEKAGLSPDQEDTTNIAEKNALGVLIDVWETTDPVPKYPEENKIKAYIINWFKGGLAKSANLKNDTEADFKEELEKYKIKILGEEEPIDDSGEVGVSDG